VFFQFVVEDDAKVLSAIAFDSFCGFLIETVECCVVPGFARLHETMMEGLLFVGAVTPVVLDKVLAITSSGEQLPWLASMQSSLLKEALCGEVPQVCRGTFGIPLVFEFNKGLGADGSELCDFGECLNFGIAQMVVVVPVAMNLTGSGAGSS